VRLERGTTYVCFRPSCWEGGEGRGEGEGDAYAGRNGEGGGFLKGGGGR